MQVLQRLCLKRAPALVAVQVPCLRRQALRTPVSFLSEPMAELRLQGRARDLVGWAYDRVVSEKAVFDTAEGKLFSDGDVEITLGIEREEQEEAGRLMHIKSSGVSYEARTGTAVTDRAAEFEFEKGEGQAVGAEYDPATRELLQDFSLLF